MLGHSVICTQVPGVWPGAEQEVELVPGRWKPRTPGWATRRRRLARRRLAGGIVLISDVLSRRPSFNCLMLFVSDMLLCPSPCHWAPAPATSWPQLTHATADISVSLGFSAFSHVVVTPAWSSGLVAVFTHAGISYAVENWFFLMRAITVCVPGQTGQLRRRFCAIVFLLQ